MPTEDFPEHDSHDDFQAFVKETEQAETSQETLYLQNKVKELLDEQQRLIMILHEKDENFPVENLLISNINVFTNDYFLENQELLNYLSNLSLNDVDEFINTKKKHYTQYSDDDYKKESFLYYYKRARETYDQVFRYFAHLNDEPEHFFQNIIWILDIIFNVELFICTKEIQGCRGFIFNLESGFGFKDRMGIVLTPLAFKSVKIFLNTLFHELTHRIYYIELHNEGSIEIDRVKHEWYAYYFDKFLQYFLPVEFSWLDEVFEEDIFESAGEISDQFIKDVFQSSIQEFEDTYERMQDLNEEETLYFGEKLKRKYHRAIRVAEVPRNYSCIVDFIWFFSDKLVNLYRSNSIEFGMIHWTLLMLLIVYSRQYEKKYHSQNNVVYNNVVFSPIGDLDNEGIFELKLYASSLVAGYTTE